MKRRYRSSLLVLACLATPPALAAGHDCQAPGPGQAIKLDGCMDGDRVVLHGLTFASSTATLRPESRQLLDEVAAALGRNPGIKVQLHGHTDSSGDPDFNRELSRFRAEAVRQYLVDAGISATRMSARGFGSSDPLAGNADPAGRARNRRVEMVLLGSGVAAAATPPPPKTVHITTFSAQPDVLRVPVGTTVTWKNYDEITHSVVLPQVASDRMWAHGFGGVTFSHTFDKPGEYAFQCGVHEDAHGKIIVTATGAASGEEPAPAYPGHTLSGLPGHVTALSQPAPAVHGHAAPAPAAALAPAAATGNVVEISGHAFAPPELLVAPGTTVTWNNQDGSRHSLVFEDLTSRVLANGESYSRSFDAPGVYAYKCGIHGYMKGTVRVQG